MIELKIVEDYYGERCAKRSGVPLINHIYEGIEILKIYNASDYAIRAYCLHPLFQNDKDLAKNSSRLHLIDPYVAMLVMEYRNKANAWLSDKVSIVNGTPVYEGEPSPGPLPEVRLMLIADKLQNAKDFVKYHYGKHPRSEELRLYFIQWFKALEIVAYI